MSKIRIKQTKSSIGRNQIQQKILISLGLNKINRERIFDDNPAVQGMIKKVKHLIVVEHFFIENFRAKQLGSIA